MIKRWLSGLSWVRLFSFLLLGYALAGPVRLSFYFYPKPFWDLLIDALLVIAAVVISMRWVKPQAKYLILVVPLLALSWMRIDFLLFSKPIVFEWVGYGFIALWGMGLSATWKCLADKKPWRMDIFSALFVLIIGFYWGYLDSSYTELFVVCVVFSMTVSIRVWYESILTRYAAGVLMTTILVVLGLSLPKPLFFESQLQFEDKVVFSEKTNFSTIDITEWNGNYWFYQDGINQFSSIDAWLYFEPFAHPPMQLVDKPQKVLVVGGENGMLVKELLKYEGVQIDLMPVDKGYLKWGKNLFHLTEQNDSSLNDSQVTVLEDRVFSQLDKRTDLYDVIFVDVPDPIDLELNQYFTTEFYELCRAALKSEGVLVTQSGSPYFATAAFQSIQATMKSAGFEVVAYHNQVLTLGEWAWTLGMAGDQNDLRSRMTALSLDKVETEWLNAEAMDMMLSFGKPYVTSGNIKVNSIKEPVIHEYYTKGNYQLQ